MILQGNIFWNDQYQSRAEKRVLCLDPHPLGRTGIRSETVPNVTAPVFDGESVGVSGGEALRGFLRPIFLDYVTLPILLQAASYRPSKCRGLRVEMVLEHVDKMSHISTVYNSSWPHRWWPRHPPRSTNHTTSRCFYGYMITPPSCSDARYQANTRTTGLERFNEMYNNDFMARDSWTSMSTALNI